jgi:hypothetical protein
MVTDVTFFYYYKACRSSIRQIGGSKFSGDILFIKVIIGYENIGSLKNNLFTIFYNPSVPYISLLTQGFGVCSLPSTAALTLSIKKLIFNLKIIKLPKFNNNKIHEMNPTKIGIKIIPMATKSVVYCVSKAPFEPVFIK